MRRRQISASNAVVNAAEQVCMLYGVRSYRQNSGAMMIPDAESPGRMRPMAMGQWRDRFGILHTRGKADLLITPCIYVPGPIHHVPICIVLWCECKSGTGRLKPDQILFRDDVLDAGAFYLQINDSAEELLRWFEAHGVKR